MQGLVLSVAGNAYALDLIDVRQVVRAPVLTRLPGAAAVVLGAMNLRGDIVPVLDTATLLELGQLDRIAHVAVVETEHGFAGLACDGEPALASLEAGAGVPELPSGRARYALDGGIVTLLALDELLSPDRLART